MSFVKIRLCFGFAVVCLRVTTLHSSVVTVSYYFQFYLCNVRFWWSNDSRWKYLYSSLLLLFWPNQLVQLIRIKHVRCQLPRLVKWNNNGLLQQLFLFVPYAGPKKYLFYYSLPTGKVGTEVVEEPVVRLGWSSLRVSLSHRIDLA